MVLETMLSGTSNHQRKMCGVSESGHADTDIDIDI